MIFDSLDLICFDAIARWESSGDVLLPECAAPGATSGGLGVWKLSDFQQRMLSQHVFGSLDWVESILPELCGHLVREMGDQWAVEALQHIAETLARREVYWAVTLPALVREGALMVDTTRTWRDLIMADFPSVGDFARRY